MCYKCEHEIDDNDDYVTCDGCNSVFHIKCIIVTKTETKARKKSKCLKLYCPDCSQSKSNGTSEKLKEVLQLLYKLFIQPTSNRKTNHKKRFGYIWTKKSYHQMQ